MAASNSHDGYVHLQQRSDVTKFSGEQLKLRDTTQSSLRCAFCAQYLLKEPRQLIECGDRICGDCYENFTAIKKTILTCPVCGTKASLEQGNADEVTKHDAHYCTHELNCDQCQSCTNPGCGNQTRIHVEARREQLLSLKKALLIDNGLNSGVEPGYLAGQSSSDPERYHPNKDTSRKIKKLKCRKRGSKLSSISPSTTPTSQPASPVSKAATGSVSPAAFAYGQDCTPLPFTSLGGWVPEVPVQRVTSSDSEGLEPNDHQMFLAQFGGRVPQVPVQRVQTSSDSEGSEPHGHLLGSRPPVEATRILVDPVYVQQQLWMLLEESMVDSATQLPARIMELIQQLDIHSFSAPTMTPLLPRQRSITGLPVFNMYPSSSQLAV